MVKNVSMPHGKTKEPTNYSFMKQDGKFNAGNLHTNSGKPKGKAMKKGGLCMGGKV